MKNLLNLILCCLPILLWSQAPDYIMYETTYLKPKAGHFEQLMDQLAQHNQKFHNQTTNNGFVVHVKTGPRTGQLRQTIGPCTFSDLEKMKTDKAHLLDWHDNILSHCESSEMETSYWRRVDEISHMPEGDGEPRPLQRIRRFEVEDHALFQESQMNIKKVFAQTHPEVPRVAFRRQFPHEDKWEWVMVYSYKNWAELDKKHPGFRETHTKIFGEEAWEPAIERFEKSMLNRQDEWVQAMPELSGARANEASSNKN